MENVGPRPSRTILSFDGALGAVHFGPHGVERDGEAYTARAVSVVLLTTTPTTTTTKRRRRRDNDDDGVHDVNGDFPCERNARAHRAFGIMWLRCASIARSP